VSKAIEKSSAIPDPIPAGGAMFLKAFLGLYLRDLRVLSRELMPFMFCAWACSRCCFSSSSPSSCRACRAAIP
jgi:hypothetical protein